jgi:DNA mismatch repair protein MutS2
VEKLVPEKQQERSDMLYQSLLEERERVEAQARKAASLHREIMELYHEVEFRRSK